MTIKKAKETADTKVFGKNRKVLDNFKLSCIYIKLHEAMGNVEISVSDQELK